MKWTSRRRIEFGGRQDEDTVRALESSSQPIWFFRVGQGDLAAAGRPGVRLRLVAQDGTHWPPLGEKGARTVLAPRMRQFLSRHPLLSVDLLTSNYREEMMAGIDVAVRFGPPDASSLIARQLLETRILTCASPAYLEQHGTPATPHDLVHHEMLLFRDPQSGRPFSWEFHRAGELIEVQTAGRLMMDDPSAALAACIAGQGIFQSLAIGIEPFFARGELVQLLPDWSEESYPLFAYHPSRHLPPAKVRAFLDFIREIATTESPAI